MIKDESCIPKGDYCYKIIDIVPAPDGLPRIRTKYCPYYSMAIRNGVYIPFCVYLDKMSLPADLPEDEYQKLLDYYGNDDKIHEAMPLFLLWDSCKECGVNEEECLN